MKKAYFFKYGLMVLTMAFTMTLCYSCSNDEEDDPTMEEPTPPSNEDTSNQQTEIKISSRNGTIRVQNAEGETVRIYNIKEVEIHKEYIDSSDKLLNVTLSPGIYIIKIGDITRKVTIR